MTKNLLIVLISIILIFGACSRTEAELGREPTASPPRSDLPDPAVNQMQTNTNQTATLAIVRTSPVTTVTQTATPIPYLQIITPTERNVETTTPTPTQPFPLSIEYLQVQEYPASEIVIEQVLEPGANYQRYIVSYLSEGLRINALLTEPDGEKPQSGWPVIVFNHGYIPPDEYRTTERYVSYVDAFARRGYIVLRSDYRGHADSEGLARGAYGYPDYTIDVLNALAAIKEFPEADPERIGMWGHSMGGYITLRAMVVSDDIKAGVIWAGVVASYEDLLTRWRRPGSTTIPSTPSAARRWRDALIETYGSAEENPEFWASISANSYLVDLSGPLQLHHGSADTSVPIEFSAKLTTQVREAGGYVEYYVYDDDNHNISINFSEAMLRSIFFFDEHVKGD